MFCEFTPLVYSDFLNMLVQRHQQYGFENLANVKNNNNNKKKLRKW